MSTVSRIKGQQPERETDAVPAQTALGRYLTDGRRLFRAVGVSRGATFVWLEDCESLQVLLATGDEVRRLRHVSAGVTAG